MVKKIARKIKLKKLISESKKNSDYETEVSKNANSLPESIEDNLKIIQSTFEGSSDLNIRRFSIGANKKKAFIVNIEGLYDKRIINENVLAPLMEDLIEKTSSEEIDIEYIKSYILNASSLAIIYTIEKVTDNILDGSTILFLDGESSALSINAKSRKHRNIDTPMTENKIRGPHEGFIEVLSTNIALVRNIIKSPDLKVETFKIGRQTRTNICLLYIKSLAEDKVVEEVKKRLDSIDIDAILESGYIEEFIEDAPLSPFPTVGNTETPDKFSAKILEGRVGILVDGSPMALTVPYLFIESFQGSEDYYAGAIVSSQLRLIRFMAFHINLFLPALYVALHGFHPNIIPQKLLLTIQVTREGLPLPVIVEAAGMIIIWEILREAGVRMPRPIGEALSIVGALIIGQVAVNAGLVSPLMIIVVSLTGIVSLLTPPLMDAATVLRIPILIFASAFGLYGVIWCYFFMIIHLTSIRSFGMPYMSPAMPFNLSGMKDYIVRLFWWLMKTRPRYIGRKELQRAEDIRMPSPKK